ncbi:MAG TPA: aldolase/citrate lyase family protein [Vineibacter sp.]|nr:aldolase/citrate lyase family protein [Vineibacter sp.]
MDKAGLRTLVGTAAPKVGTFVFEFAVPGIGQILKAAGADFAVIDMEHSGFGFDTVRACVKYMQAGDLPVIVRVPSKAYDHVARVMDIGADGVMVPMVSSLEQAVQAVRAVKYFPQGHRGVATGLAHDRFSRDAAPLAQRFASHNARTLVVLQIEDGAGADAADAIAALDGVDVLWVGHNDLSVALGKPGAFADPAFVAAEEKTIAACRKHGKSAGRLARDAAEAALFTRRGYDFVSIAGDVGLLQAALADGIAQVRRS